MALIAAHLNDTGIVAAKDDTILYREPGFALLENDRLVTGAAAYANARLKPRNIHHRFWSELETKPLLDSRFQHLTSADLVSKQLEAMWRQVSDQGDRLAIAVPAYMNNDNLGLLLGIAMDQGIPLVAMVDSAVAATRRRYEHAVPVHIDFGLHFASLTRLAQDEQVQVDRTSVVPDSGVLALYEIWLKVIAEAFVQQSRFDPLHTAATEQYLQDSLPQWLASANAAESVSIDVDFGGVTHTAEIESLQLVAAAAPIYQNIVSSLRALYRAEELPAVQLSDRAAHLPGLAQTIKSRVGGEVFLLGPGAVAQGLLKRCREESGGSGITLTRRLPWDQAPVVVEVKAAGGSSAAPTHLLYGHEALSLNGSPLVVGSQIVDGERCLNLDQPMPGVSRRHCILSSDNGQLVVTDHSRYGTFLNGHRIAGSAVLQTGDLIRVGTPGFELRLIHAEDGHGT